MRRLLCGLNPLEELALRGSADASTSELSADITTVGEAWFNAVLTRHCPSLRILRIKGPVLSAKQIIQMRDAFLNLRKLDIEILRSLGDCREANVYCTLGAMRKLERLTLGLQVVAALGIGRLWTHFFDIDEKQN
jgi:hypothetical protein